VDGIPVKQIKEIILVAADAGAARRFYRDILGLAMPEAADRWNLAPVGSQFLGAAQAGTMSYPGFTGRVHLGLEIDHADLGPAVERLRQHGIEVTIRPQPPGYMGTPDAVGAYFLDPDGNLIELWAALPPGAPRPA
jgi:catechol 2,3-dioxygenase-like lactoylglutathione lyase family enzyme